MVDRSQDPFKLYYRYNYPKKEGTAKRLGNLINSGFMEVGRELGQAVANLLLVPDVGLGTPNRHTDISRFDLWSWCQTR